MDNATRRGLLTRHRQSQFPGSILDVFKAHDQGIDLLGEFEQQQMQAALTPQQQQQGLRPSHQAGNVNQSMTFPNVPPNTPFNTMGMKAPIDIKKFNEQGHLVKSYDNVPPGVQNLPTGPQRGTVIETPANMQSGGEVKKYQAGAFLAAGIGIGKVVKTAKQRIADNIYPVGYRGESTTPATRLYNAVIKNEPEPGSKKNSDQEGNGRTKHNLLERQNILAYAMGQPNTLQESQYKPTKSKNSDSVYYRSPRTEWNLENELTKYASRGEGLNLIDSYSNSDPGYHDFTTKASSDAINVLGNYTVDKGEDSRGKYISYYDKWDLDPFPGNTKLSSTIQKGIGIKAPEMYGRIYYDPKTGAPIGGKKDIPSWDSKYLKEEASSVASKTKTNMQGGGVIPGMQQYAQYNNLNPELAAAVASRPQNNDRLTSSTDAQMRQFNNRGEQTRVNNAQTNMSNRLSTAGSNAYQFHKDKPLDALGMDLAIAGQLPIIGEVADLANAGISGARGIYNTAVGDTAKAKEQFTLAGLSAASAIPFAGNAAGAARIAKAGHKISHKAHTLEKGVIGAKAFKASAYESKQTGGFKGSDLASAMKVGAGAAVTSTVGRGISALAKNRNLDKDAFAQWKTGQDRAHQAMLGMDYDEYCLTGDCPENPFQGDPPNFKDWRNHDYFSASQTNARPVGRLVQGFEDKPLQGKSILKQGVRDGIVTGALTYGTNKLLDNTRFGRKVKRNFNVKVGWNGRRQSGGVRWQDTMDWISKEYGPDQFNDTLNLTALDLVSEHRQGIERPGAVRDSIAYHETGKQQRMQPNAVQIAKDEDTGELVPGVGRGKYMYDKPSTLTAANRIDSISSYMGLETPAFIQQMRRDKGTAAADTLTAEQQDMLYMGDLIQGEAPGIAYGRGDATLEDLWYRGHNRRPDERKARKEFQTSMKGLQNDNLNKYMFMKRLPNYFEQPK